MKDWYVNLNIDPTVVKVDVSLPNLKVNIEGTLSTLMPLIQTVWVEVQKQLNKGE